MRSLFTALVFFALTAAFALAQSSSRPLLMPDGSLKGTIGSPSNPSTQSTDDDSILLFNLRSALSLAKNSAERHQVAVRLEQAARDVSARRRTMYQRQAEREFHVPELNASVEQLIHAERKDPNNPRTGEHANETIGAMNRLHQARIMANHRAAELASLDPDVSIALNAAQASRRLNSGN